MQELIKEWEEFIEYRDKAKIVDTNGVSMPLYYNKPDFYDFMQWLSDKYK